MTASIVLSLRDDVLAVPDQQRGAVGGAESGRRRSASPRASTTVATPIATARGTTLARRFRSRSNPTGILETRCGERLWTTTATVQGDGIEASAPGVSVSLLKRNTFASQYCNGKAPTNDIDGTPITPPDMQVGVIHESADLFQPGSEVASVRANEFTAALLYPWFNIRRTDFYNSSFKQGSSQELAGRGLYGDYVLLFPKQVLEDGFALDKVEDVLLRFDYLSVDNLSQ